MFGANEGGEIIPKPRRKLITPKPMAVRRQSATVLGLVEQETHVNQIKHVGKATSERRASEVRDSGVVGDIVVVLAAD